MMKHFHSGARYLIYAAGWIVPTARREEWMREWMAELAHVERVARGQVLRFASGALADAWYLRMDSVDRQIVIHEFRTRTASPEVCLMALCGLIVAIAICSLGLPATRDVLLPLPYENPDRIATVAQGGVPLATRMGAPVERIAQWRRSSHLLEDVAAYSWRDEDTGVGRMRIARVSANFFALLGARFAGGERATVANLTNCPRCAVVSFEYWRAHSWDSHVTVAGQRYMIAAVLEANFWFLSRDVGVWILSPSLNWERGERAGAVARLRNQVTVAEASRELQKIAEEHGASEWDALVEMIPLADRVHSVLWSFLLALGLAVVIVLTGVSLGLPQGSFRAGAFFTAKTSLALGAVLLAGLEFTPAPSITMLGGTDLYTEPLSTWLFLMGCAGVLTWSLYDQRMRCRRCLRRLGLAAHVGCSGSLLLDWAGTELVCVEGHGMLHVPEMEASWREGEQWTVLDDSWEGLFARRS